MGNCFKKMIPEKYSLIENSDEIMHKIEINSEDIDSIKTDNLEINKNNIENFELIQQDMDKLMLCHKNLKQELNYLSHQLSSKYGGSASDGAEDFVEGPSETMFSTSE